MSAVPPPLPSWADFAVRAVIYACVAALAFWWHPALGAILAVFGVIDLLHHAADTARRRAGYVPIPRHPSMPGAPNGPLKRTPRALLIIFGITWLAALFIGKALMDTSWADAAIQAFAVAGSIGVIAILLFPFAVAALLWVMSVTLGLLLSFADVLTLLIAAPDARKSWHRVIDATDHRLADLILGQEAGLPLRADLAERAVETHKDAKGAA